MFITPEEVNAHTPYDDITMDQVRQAQFIIEMYVGRTESDIDSARDMAIMARATAAQAIYMRDNPDLIYNQVKVTTVKEGGQLTTFDQRDDSPFISPLAVIACRRVSWRQSRSVKVGRTFQHPQNQMNMSWDDFYLGVRQGGWTDWWSEY